MTLLDVVDTSILAHLKRHVDSAATRVITFYESSGETVIIYVHGGITREVRRHVLHGSIPNMLHLIDFDLTGES